MIVLLILLIIFCLIVSMLLFKHAEAGTDDTALKVKRASVWIAQEIHKAQVGAANAEPWATELVDRVKEKFL